MVFPCNLNFANIDEYEFENIKKQTKKIEEEKIYLYCEHKSNFLGLHVAGLLLWCLSTSLHGQFQLMLMACLTDYQLVNRNLRFGHPC